MLHQHGRHGLRTLAKPIKVGLKSGGPTDRSVLWQKATGPIYFGRSGRRVENQVGRVGPSDELRPGATYNGPGPTEDRPMPTLRF